MTERLASFSLTDLGSAQDSTSPLGFSRRKESSARRTLLFGTSDDDDSPEQVGSPATEDIPGHQLTFRQKGAVVAMSLSLIGSFFSGNIIYPFAPFMVHDFFPHISENKLGYYTGFIDSSFYLGPLISSVFWARLSDTHGRRSVIQCAMLGTALLSAVFGLSVNFPMAVTVRFLWGLLDSSVAVVKTTMGDLARDPSFNMDQARLFGLIGLSGGFGRTFGSFLGGWLSAIYGGDDHSRRKCSAVTRVFCAFPYFLPCLAPACLIAVALGFVYLYFPETSTSSIGDDNSSHVSRLSRPLSSFVIADKSSVILPKLMVESEPTVSDALSSLESPPKAAEVEIKQRFLDTSSKSENKAEDSHGIRSDNQNHNKSEKVSWAEVMRERELLWAVFIYFLTCVYSTGFNSMMPVWLLTSNSSEGGGLSMRVNEIGTVWALVGPMYMFTQTFLYHRVCGWLGYMKTAQVTLICSGLCCVFIPFLSSPVLLGGFDSRSELPRWRQWLNVVAVAVLSGVLIACRVMAISTLTLIVNNASRNAAAMRATANGLSQSAGSLGRLIAPMIFCNMFAAIVAYDQRHHSSLLSYRFSFYMIASVAFLCAVLLKYSFGPDFESRLHSKSHRSPEMDTSEDTGRVSTSVELVNTFSKLDESSLDSLHSSVEESE